MLQLCHAVLDLRLIRLVSTEAKVMISEVRYNLRTAEDHTVCAACVAGADREAWALLVTVSNNSRNCSRTISAGLVVATQTRVITAFSIQDWFSSLNSRMSIKLSRILPANSLLPRLSAYPHCGGVRPTCVPSTYARGA